MSALKFLVDWDLFWALHSMQASSLSIVMLGLRAHGKENRKLRVGKIPPLTATSSNARVLKYGKYQDVVYLNLLAYWVGLPLKYNAITIISTFLPYSIPSLLIIFLCLFIGNSIE